MTRIKPKISTVKPFDYKDMIDKALFAYLDPYCGNSSNDLRPIVIMGEDEYRSSTMWGYEIDTYEDGIYQSAEVYYIPKEDIDTGRISQYIRSENVESLICGWLLIIQDPSMLKLPLFNF